MKSDLAFLGAFSPFHAGKQRSFFSLLIDARQCVAAGSRSFLVLEGSVVKFLLEICHFAGCPAEIVVGHRAVGSGVPVLYKMATRTSFVATDQDPRKEKQQGNKNAIFQCEGE